MSKTKLDKIKDLKKENKIKTRRTKKRKTWCDEFIFGQAYKRAMGEKVEEELELSLPEEEVKDLLDIFADNANKWNLGEL